jgi:DASH complex subunit Spc34
MTTVLQPHLESISSTAETLSSLPFTSIPTTFVHAILDQSSIDALIRDPHPHERGLFTVRDPAVNPLSDPTEGKVHRAKQEKTSVSPLLLAKFSSGANIEAEVFLRSAKQLLQV